MPSPTLDQIKHREAALKKALAEQGESMDPAKRRSAGKKLRRAQRRRREMVVHAARIAPKPKETAEAPAEAGAAAEESKAD